MKKFKSLDILDDYLKNHDEKYIIKYEEVGKYLKLYSNYGKCCKVENNKKNISRINHEIIKNKINIAKKIDEYDSNFKNRMILILLNILLIILSGLISVLSFFAGSYIFFLASLFVFSLIIIITSMNGLEQYLNVREISRLKKLTGYKLEYEVNLSDLKTLKENL